ncbi:CinA family protein [Microbacterium sp. MMO-113]|uniref:CinA family protein n=1 Tax=Microbacterium sp. MMO-113 TaxID=3081273 RepID=UPI0030176B61
MTAPNETPDLEHLGELARSRGLRVSVAESLTSGRLANTIGAGEGASGWFAGGIVAYFTEVKERVLGLTPGTDPTSAACAEQLASGARELFDAEGLHPAGPRRTGSD